MLSTRIVGLGLLMVVVGACKGKGKPSADPAGSGTAVATGSAAPADAAAPSPAMDAAAVAGEPGCEGWRAKVVEHRGMGEASVAVECAAGKVTLTSTMEGAHDDEAKENEKTLTRDAWVALWKKLDEANWRGLPADCPKVDPPPESFSVTELDLTITDGKTTKQLTCEGANVTSAHEQIMEALDGAAE